MHWIVAVIAGLAGLALGYVVRLAMARRGLDEAGRQAGELLDRARNEAETTRKDAQLQAKAEVIKAREEFEQSTRTRRQELSALEERIAQKEANLERKVAVVEKKEKALEDRVKALDDQSAELAAQRKEVDRLAQQARDELQRVAAMTRDEARKIIMAKVETEVHNEMGVMIRRTQEKAREQAERDAKKIVAQAVERFASGHAGELMTSTVALPSEDMKGRIIGRDGRNIRSLEAVTGVNILIDDTPEAVVLSSFDPIRREVARLSLEQLLADGRIHPARIEEVVAKVQEDMTEVIRKAGEEALYLADVQNVEPDLVRTLGRLKFRTSYTQNVLQHSIEVAHLMGVMAGEMGLDPALARRVGLFHDIGKALDHEVEGGHAVIGADVLKRAGEEQTVVNAVASHHEEVERESLYAVLCMAADSISSSRVGARSATAGVYVKRLEKLEGIANEFEGVRKSYAIQAGREVRVVVDPEKMDDNAAMVLARNIRGKIETDLKYPGQIRVTVIRETRCVEYAH
jgi:ribonuclease Y